MKNRFTISFLICLFIFLMANPSLFAGDVVFDDPFTMYRHITSIYPSALEHVQELGYDPVELLQMPHPQNWYVQWRYFPKNCSFGKHEQGMVIHSPDDQMWMLGEKFTIHNNKYTVAIDISNLSAEKQAVITCEFRDFSSLVEDLTVLKQETLEPGARKQVTYEISCKNGYAFPEPSLRIHGDVVLHRFKIEAEPELGVTCLEGTVVERSPLPDPAKSNYPNCRYIIRFEGNAILGGDSCNRELSLTIEGFRNKKLLKSDKIKAGDKIVCSVVPFDTLPEKEQETQVADNLNLFELDNYYVYAAGVIDEFSSLPTPFADGVQKYQSVFDRRLNPALSESVIDAQKKQIQADLDKMNNFLDDYADQKEQLNESFVKALKAENDKDAVGRNRIQFHKNDWLWRMVDSSFWCYPVERDFIAKYPPLNQEKLGSLLALKHCCEANGVQLIVSIVPDCMDISARVILKEFRNIPDFRTALLVKTLSEAGIEALYASDAILANFNRYPFAYMFPYDVHPGDTVQDVLAEQMAKRLARYQLRKTLDADKITLKPGDHVYVGEKNCMFPADCDIGDNQPGTPYPCQCVYYDGEKLTADRNSEILVIGNSFIRTPRGTPESYPAHLARHTLVNPDAYMVQGHGPMVTLIERLFKQPGKYLKGKKVVILQMGVEHFFADLAWNNIEKMDAYQLAMDGKSAVREIVPEGEKVTTLVQMNLTAKHEYQCAANTPKNIAKIACTELAVDKPVVCLIPACAEPDKIICLQCNGKTEEIPPYLSYAPAWNNLIFELPAGTKEIEVSVSGPEGALVAIQKITLLQ